MFSNWRYIVYTEKYSQMSKGTIMVEYIIIQIFNMKGLLLFHFRYYSDLQLVMTFFGSFKYTV